MHIQSKSLYHKNNALAPEPSVKLLNRRARTSKPSMPSAGRNYGHLISLSINTHIGQIKSLKTLKTDLHTIRIKDQSRVLMQILHQRSVIKAQGV